jgi:putative chitinase
MKYTDIIQILEKNGITNKLIQAHFLTQVEHESAGFTKLSENPQYRFARAKQIWASRINQINELQKKYNLSDNDFAPQPELFNAVYGSRMGNEKNGINDNDGFVFRGRGFLQLTGKNNYEEFLKWLHSKNQKTNITNVYDVLEYVQTHEGAILSALWFWHKNNLNFFALKDKLTDIIRRINGGLIGIEERKKLLNKYKKILGI